jgi:DNA-binding GntR family transcriptional regulator
MKRPVRKQNKKRADDADRDRVLSGALASDIRDHFEDCAPTRLPTKLQLRLGFEDKANFYDGKDNGFGGADKTMARALNLLLDDAFLRYRVGEGLSLVGTEIERAAHDRGGVAALLEFRLGLEPMAAMLAARRVKRGESTTVLDEAYGELKTSQASGLVASERSADYGFHKAIHTVSDNFWIRRALAQVDSFVTDNVHDVVTDLYSSVKGYRTTTAGQHDKIYEAILSGRDVDARTAMMEHLDYAHNLILKRLDQRRRRRPAQ